MFGTTTTLANVGCAAVSVLCIVECDRILDKCTKSEKKLQVLAQRATTSRTVIQDISTYTNKLRRKACEQNLRQYAKLCTRN